MNSHVPDLVPHTTQRLVQSRPTWPTASSIGPTCRGYPPPGSGSDRIFRQRGIPSCLIGDGQLTLEHGEKSCGLTPKSFSIPEKPPKTDLEFVAENGFMAGFAHSFKGAPDTGRLRGGPIGTVSRRSESWGNSWGWEELQAPAARTGSAPRSNRNASCRQGLRRENR